MFKDLCFAFKTPAKNFTIPGCASLLRAPRKKGGSWPAGRRADREFALPLPVEILLAVDHCAESKV